MRNATVTGLAITALTISSISLAWQIHNRKTPSKLAPYLVPVRMTELDRKMELAQIEMIRSAALSTEGLGIPQIHTVNPEDDSIIIQVVVSPADLPQAHDRQRERLLNTAVFAVGSVTKQFDPEKHEISPDNVEVIFLDLMASIKSGKREIFATYKNGQLSFH